MHYTAERSESQRLPVSSDGAAVIPRSEKMQQSGVLKEADDDRNIEVS